MHVVAMATAVLIGIAVAGCAGVPATAPQPSSPQSSPAADVEALLAYRQRLAALTSEGLAEELVAAKRALPGDGSQHLKLFVLFSLESSPYRDDAEALAELKAFRARSDQPRDLQRFAGLMESLLARSVAESAAHTATRRRLEEQVQRTRLLSDQIEALKSIETGVGAPQPEPAEAEP